MVRRKIKKIISIIVLMIILFPYTSVLAITQEQAGRAIAQYAYNYCMSLGKDSGNNQSVYDHDNGEHHDRKYGYLLQLHSGIAECGDGTGSYTNKYPMDCVGFISMTIHQSLGIGNNNDWESFITPKNVWADWLEKVSGSPQPGDIGQSSSIGHVIIYLGAEGEGYSVAESLSQYPNFTGPVLTTSSIAPYTMYRIKASKASEINQNDVRTSPDGAKLLGGSGQVTQSEFYYNGIPDGKYSVTAGFEGSIIGSLMEILDYIVGFMALLQRMSLVGWTAIIENLINSTIKSIDNDTTNDQIKEQNPTSYEAEEDTITVESIIFNDVDVFDVNFFKNLSEDIPEGEPVTE